MCLVCNSTGVNVCAGGACNVSFWQQNLNFILLGATPIVGGVFLWSKNLLMKVRNQIPQLKKSQK